MTKHRTSDERAETYRNWLLVLLALFVFRVAAQLAQAVYSVSFLPSYEAWHSGALPYPLLVASQLAIIAFCGRIVWQFHSKTVQVSRIAGLVYLGLGGVYFAVMVFRLAAGYSFAAGHPWLGAHLPAIFHLVLASFLLVVGFFHSEYTGKLVARLAYPGIILAALLSHSLLLQNGVNLLIATYAPVLLGALIIMFLERTNPHQKEWLPNRHDVQGDATYMILVQILLPRFLGFFVAIAVLKMVNLSGTVFSNPWPNEWPVYAQVLLMMISAEFMRYWVHRLAHNWTPLWQLHAVHHSPHKLYWINVGRFHPLEKALQYIFDALPFILLGVSEDVLALYFVFYALNGFFQHCNIELRLGFLNYIISGPELHRWHHSKLITESNNNYGNNLIIWDLLFGTWFLPKYSLVGELGLQNRQYPMGFLSQLKTPFIKALDKRT